MEFMKRKLWLQSRKNLHDLLTWKTNTVKENELPKTYTVCPEKGFSTARATPIMKTYPLMGGRITFKPCNEVEAQVLKTIKLGKINDLHFWLGSSKASFPKFLLFWSHPIHILMLLYYRDKP